MRSNFQKWYNFGNFKNMHMNLLKNVTFSGYGFQKDVKFFKNCRSFEILEYSNNKKMEQKLYIILKLEF
jgi:hypothetical protein